METNNFETPVMDERIVKLNELKSVKMASISSKKRPAAKANKAAAQYILENWDNTEMLQKYVNDPTSPVESYEVYCIADSRVKQLMIEAAKIENARKETEARMKKAASKKETKKADKTEQPKEKTAKTARKVGDVHPKHPTWIWTEYTPGKFDWRTNPKDKKQGQRTDKTDTKKEPKTKAADKKAAKAKAETPKKEEKKQLTLEEWLAMPKTTKQKSSMSKAQKDAFKLINKGYRITADKKFFENENNERRGCNWASVEAMLRRYGIDYIPVGLVKEAK